MNLSSFCLKRPVFAIVINLILIVMGVMAFTSLHTRFFPNIEQPLIMVRAQYLGASSALMETSVTTPIENAISSLPGIDYMRSKSSSGQTEIQITLKQGVQRDALAEQMRAKISGIRDQLPDALKPPVVQVGYGENPMMEITFTDANKSLLAVRDYLQRFVVHAVQQVPGIASAQIWGVNPYAMQLNLDPSLMAAKQVSVNEVVDAVQQANVALPAGEIKTPILNFPITTKSLLNTAQQFNQIVIRDNAAGEVKLNDIGQAKLASDNQDKILFRLDGQKAVDLGIFSQADANPLQVANGVHKTLKHLLGLLPAGMKMYTVIDFSKYLRASVHEVYETLILAVIFVGLVIFAFFARWRSVLIPMATIPVCIVGSFVLILLFGFSINTITLLALVLAIGLVVDDAIVMLENIQRHCEMGHDSIKAAQIGSREIGFTIIAMTITLAAVYAPIGLISGETAIIFRQFAFTLAGAVLISGFVALTLSPVMCARLLTSTQNQAGLANRVERGLKSLTLLYQKLLTTVISKRLLVLVLCMIVMLSGIFLYRSLPEQFMPQADLGFVLAEITPPTGASAEYIDKYSQKAYQLLNNVLHPPMFSSVVGSNSQFFNHLFMQLPDYNKRTETAQQAATKTNQLISHLPGAVTTFFAPSFFGGDNQRLTVAIMTFAKYSQLHQIMQTLMKELKNYPGLIHVTDNMKFDSQQYTIQINRPLAANLHVSVAAIDKAMAVLLGGEDISHFVMQGQQYNVLVQANADQRKSINSLNQYYVKSADNKMIPLSALIKVQSVIGQQMLPHYDRLRSAQLSGQLAPGYSMGQVVNHLQERLPQLLPENTQFAFTNSAEKMLKSSHHMAMIFLLALIFIYLVLAAQFESFIDPFIILLNVPLCLVGGLLALKLAGGSLNIYTNIALVTLVGLIAKHGILITQFANQLRKQGLLKLEAVIKAASLRLRPILMTTAAMVFAAIPLILTKGADAASRQQIGWVILGGMIIGSVFSLLIVPVAYTYLSSKD